MPADLPEGSAAFETLPTEPSDAPDGANASGGGSWPWAVVLGALAALAAGAKLYLVLRERNAAGISLAAGAVIGMVVGWSGGRGAPEKRLGILAAVYALLAVGLAYGGLFFDNHRLAASLTDVQRQRLASMDTKREVIIVKENTPGILREDTNRANETMRDVVATQRRIAAFREPEWLAIEKRLRPWTWMKYAGLACSALCAPLFAAGVAVNWARRTKFKAR